MGAAGSRRAPSRRSLHHTPLTRPLALFNSAPPGVLGYYQGLRTKIVQSVLGAALLFVCKERIAEVTRNALLGVPPPPAKALLLLAAAR